MIFLVNFLIMAQRVYFYRDFATLNGYIPNFFDLVSRACGKALLFNSALILVHVLRKTITSLTRVGFSTIQVSNCQRPAYLYCACWQKSLRNFYGEKLWKSTLKVTCPQTTSWNITEINLSTSGSLTKNQYKNSYYQELQKSTFKVTCYYLPYTKEENRFFFCQLMIVNSLSIGKTYYVRNSV